MSQTIKKFGVTALIAVGVLIVILAVTQKPKGTKRFEHVYVATVMISNADSLVVKIDTLPDNAPKSPINKSSVLMLNVKPGIVTEASGKALRTKDLNQSDVIRIDMDEIPIMTKSIPPQIAGDSIHHITRMNE